MAQIRVPGYSQAFDVGAEGPPLLMTVAGTVANVGTLDFPGTIAAGQTFSAGPLATGGMSHFALGGTLSQPGTLEVRAFLDAGGIAQTGTTAALALTANVGAVLDVNYGEVVQSVSLSIVNAGSAAGTLTHPLLVVSAR